MGHEVLPKGKWDNRYHDTFRQKEQVLEFHSTAEWVTCLHMFAVL